MKNMTKLLSFFLILCLLVGTFTSCLPEKQAQETPETTPPVTTPAPDGGPIDPPTPPLDPLPELPGGLAYTLTDADLQAFRDALVECEAMFTGNGGTEEEMSAMLEKVDDLYYHVDTQGDIAYVLYCLDQSNERLQEAYLFAQESLGDLYEEYNAMCKRIDASTSEYREVFFEGWSEEDLEDMRGFSSELTELNKESAELLVAYRDLSSSEFSNGAVETYIRMLEINDRIAELNGYDSYWEYGYAKIYGRDFGKDELELIRANAKANLSTMIGAISASFNSKYNALSAYKQGQVYNFLTLDYVSYLGTALEGYFNTFSEERQLVMRGMFDEENSFFAEASSNSYSGAFTGYFQEYDRPYCYYGNGYKTTMTILHEMGHYCSAISYGGLNVPLELAELQSQGNEWLFHAYRLQGTNTQVQELVMLNELYSTCTTILVSIVIDHFEQICYERMPKTAGELEQIMNDLLDEYGRSAFTGIDMQYYWRVVCVESPVYYISYAVSALSSLEIFAHASEVSYESAQEIYLYLASEVDKELGFFEQLTLAGLSLPTDAGIYETLKQYIGGN